MSTLKSSGDLDGYYTFTDLPNAAWVSIATTATQVFFMNLVFSHYLSALKERPYVSGRVSSVYGDPLNDAEVLRIRLISFGLTYRSIIIWVEGRPHKWVVHTFCALWLLLLVYSSSKMFGGSFREVRERLSSQRGRVNSAYSDNGERAGELFDEMITEDNVVAKMGSRRKIKDMFANSSLEEEKVRWSLAAGEEKLTWLGYVFVGIKVIFGGILVFLIFCATIFYSCVFRIALISLQVMAVLSWVRVEWGYGFKDSYRRLMGCYHGGEQDNGASDGANDKDEIELAENPLHQEEESTKGGGEGGGDERGGGWIA